MDGLLLMLLTIVELGIRISEPLLDNRIPTPPKPPHLPLIPSLPPPLHPPPNPLLHRPSNLILIANPLPGFFPHPNPHSHRPIAAKITPPMGNRFLWSSCPPQT